MKSYIHFRNIEVNISLPSYLLEFMDSRARYFGCDTDFIIQAFLIQYITHDSEERESFSKFKKNYDEEDEEDEGD